jgi:hypothetical protein
LPPIVLISCLNDQSAGLQPREPVSQDVGGNCFFRVKKFPDFLAPQRTSGWSAPLNSV